MKVVRSYTYPSLTGAAVAEQDGAGALFDADAIVTSLSTATSASTVEDAGFNGTIGGSDCLPWRGLTVTTSASAATYNTTDPIVATVEVEVKGKTIELTIEATLTQAGGGETLDFSGPFTRVKSIAIPAQDGTGGAFEFGVGDVYSNRRPSGKNYGEDFKHVMGLGSGDIKVGYAGGTVDVLKTAVGRQHDVTPFKIFRDGTDAIFSVGA